MSKKKKVFKPRNPEAKQLEYPIFRNKILPKKERPKPDKNEEWD